MSRYYKQMQRRPDEARQGLRERLAREEIGDAAYDKMVSQDDRGFKIFGVVFIALFAAMILVVAWLD